MRVGPPELSGTRTFWPVQEAMYTRVLTWGERGYRDDFTGWETIAFFDTVEEAREYIKENEHA